MSDVPQHLDAKFIEAKRRELTSLRDALKKSAAATEVEEDSVKQASAAQPREFEDDAQKLDTLEKEGILVNRSVEGWSEWAERWRKSRREPTDFPMSAASGFRKSG